MSVRTLAPLLHYAVSALFGAYHSKYLVSSENTTKWMVCLICFPFGLLQSTVHAISLTSQQEA